MTLKKLVTIGAVGISVIGLSACNNITPAKTVVVTPTTHTQTAATMNVLQIAQSNPDFSILVEAVQAAGLVNVLGSPNANYTIFAPTNAAFMQLLTDTNMSKAQLFADKPLLLKVLGYHVLNGKMPVYAKDVKPGNLTMLSDDVLMVTSDGKLMDEKGRSIRLLKTDLAATNGVIHVIDKVLLPN